MTRQTKADTVITLIAGPTANSLWNRAKTIIWNFILPPHIRLAFKEEDSNPHPQSIEGNTDV